MYMEIKCQLDATECFIADSGVPKGGFGVFKPPPQNSEDTGGDLHCTTKKNRRLDFLL